LSTDWLEAVPTREIVAVFDVPSRVVCPSFDLNPTNISIGVSF
jgi:hypothetical protein